MKQSIKILSALLIGLAVIGAVTILAVKYFDVLVKVFDNVKTQISRKKPTFFGDSCCDYDDDDEDMEESDELSF